MLAPNGDGYLLTWNCGHFQLTAQIDDVTGLPTITTAPRYNNFSAFVSSFHCLPTMIPNDEDEAQQQSPPLEDDSIDPIIPTASTKDEHQIIHVNDRFTKI